MKQQQELDQMKQKHNQMLIESKVQHQKEIESVLPTVEVDYYPISNYF